MTSLSFQEKKKEIWRLLCPFITFYKYAEPFLRYAIVGPYFWLWFIYSKIYSS